MRRSASRAALFPTLSLTASLGAQSAELSQLLSSGAGIWSIGLAARLEAARHALELSNERYRAGYSPFLEVLDAQRTANDAELAFVRNRQARLAFSVDLMRSLGGGWVD